MENKKKPGAVVNRASVTREVASVWAANHTIAESANKLVLAGLRLFISIDLKIGLDAQALLEAVFLSISSYGHAEDRRAFYSQANQKASWLRQVLKSGLCHS